MRLTALVLASTTLTIVTLSGFATANSGGEELLRLDLQPAGGSVYYLGCVTGSKNALDCGILSIWEQTNEKDGLQTSVVDYGDQQVKPDQNLLA